MKRLMAWLLALALAAGGAFAAEAEEDWTEIRDAAGLKAMAAAPRGRYRLTEDIDMGGADWTPIAFSGELDGGGHTLYNLRVTEPGAEVRTTHDGNMKAYDAVFAGLFSALEGATVRNLRLTGARVAVESDGHCFAALLAGYVDRTEITGCAVQGRVRLTSSGVMAGAGGFAGFGCGRFDRCDAKVELVLEDRNFESRCEQFMGGVLACGTAGVSACMVEIDGYISCHGYVHSGGLMGMYHHCGTEYPSEPVINNIVEGRIRFFEDNPDRRAYCEPIIGEGLVRPPRSYGNMSAFKRDEVFKYDEVLEPEQCDEPDYIETVEPPAGARWGFTRHECAVCGYHWLDDYTPPDQ